MAAEKVISIKLLSKKNDTYISVVSFPFLIDDRCMLAVKTYGIALFINIKSQYLKFYFMKEIGQIS